MVRSVSKSRLLLVCPLIVLVVFAGVFSPINNASARAIAEPSLGASTTSTSTCGLLTTATSQTGGSYIDVLVDTNNTVVALPNRPFGAPDEDVRIFDPQITPLNPPIDTQEYGLIQNQLVGWTAYEDIETQTSGTNKCGVNISLSPLSGPPGTVVTVTGTGWPYPGDALDVCLWVCGYTFPVDGNGNIHTTLTIPADNPPDDWTVSMDSTISPSHYAVNFYAFTVTSGPTGVDLSVTQTDSPDPVAWGQELTYRISVANNGPASATNVILTDPLPNTVSFVSAITGQWNCTGPDGSTPGGTMTCNRAMLPQGTSDTIVITVSPLNTVGTITNRVTVAANESDPNTANNAATATTTMVSYSIAGKVTNSSGTGISGVTVNATGTINKSATTATDGSYTLTNLPVGTYTLSASKNGYTFSPPSAQATVPPNQAGVNFTGTTSVPAPVANFDATPVTGTASLPVHLHNTSTGTYTGCIWNYGDGQAGNTCAALHDHLYTTAGKYTVKLTVSGPGGSSTKTRSNYITVSAPAPGSLSISGNLYIDTNQNGVKDTGESNYAGATIALSGAAAKSTNTDTSGNYTFTSLQTVSYIVTLTVPTGYRATTTNPVNIPLTARTTVNFGIANNPPSIDTTKPGGVWLTPANNFAITGNLFHFAAHAYDNPGGSGIAHVNFTANIAGKWIIVCADSTPNPGTDIYECDWSLVDSSGRYIPNGLLKVSFDVYDNAGNYNLAPNGIHQGTVQRPIFDLGFRPNPNGYQFQNQPLSPTPEMFEQFFGRNNVRKPDGITPCAEAQAYYHRYDPANLHGGNGYVWVANKWSCVGFSLTSLLSYLNWAQPQAGPFAIPHYDQIYGQQKSTQLTDSIAYYARVQTSKQWADGYGEQIATCRSNTDGPISRIEKGIQNRKPFVLILNSTKGSHAVVPYRVNEISPTEADVYIYDSESPGEERSVHFQRLGTEWIWTYTFVGSLAKKIGYYTSARCEETYLYPVERALDAGVPPEVFCLPPATVSASVSPNVTARTRRVLASIPPQGDWVMRDNAGRRLGWANGQLVSEIPNAYSIPQAFGDPSLSYRALYLPEASYALELTNAPSNAMNYSLFGDGRMIEVNGNLQSVGTSAGIQVNSSLEQATVTKLQNLTSFALKLDNELPLVSRVATVTGSGISGNGDLDAQFDGDRLVASRAAGTLQYRIRFEQMGAQGGAFLSELLTLGANQTHIFKPVQWSNLHFAGVVLEIHRASDGTLLETRVLKNQLSYVYLTMLTQVSRH